MKDFVLKFTTLMTIMMIALNASAKVPDVNGKIVDENGEPMPFVNVVMLSMPDSTYVKGGITDEQGMFNLTALQNGGGHYHLATRSHATGRGGCSEQAPQNPC